MAKPAELNPNLFICLYFFTKLFPMVISLVAVILGYKLFILGVTGQASLDIRTEQVSAQLLNAAPGLFFGLGGLAALIISILKGLRIDFGGDTQGLHAGALRVLQAASIGDGPRSENVPRVKEPVGKN